MVDLVTLNTNVPGYGDFAKGMAMQNEVAKGQLEYQQMRDAYEAQKGLRALFAQNPNASFSDISQYDPKLAAELSSKNLDMQYKQSQIQESQAKTAKTKEEVMSFAGAPVAEQYFMDVQNGMPQEQALQKFRSNIGVALSEVEQEHGFRPPKGFNPDQLDPMGVLLNSAPHGYKSPYLENLQKYQQQSMLNQLPPQMSPTQAYGSVEMGPYGPRRVPGIGGQVPRMPGQMPQQQAPDMSQFGPAVKATAEDIPALQQAYDEATDVNQKQQIGALLNQLKQQAQGQQQSQFVTPQEEQKLKIDEKRLEAEIQAEKELKVEKGKEKLKEQESAHRAMNAYDLLPEPDRIRNLIKGSISGDAEYWADRLGGVVGKSLESGDMTAALKVIEGKMAETVAMFPGAQSDKELDARMKVIGNPSAEISPEKRLKAFDEWQNMMQKYVAQNASYEDTKLLDMVNEGKLTKEQAMQIRKNRMSGGR